MQAETAWSFFRGDRFRLKEWDDDAVVYDIISGDTHVVEPLAMELLQLLRERSSGTSAELVAEVLGLFQGESRTEVSVSVGETLLRLQQLGLVVGSDR